MAFFLLISPAYTSEENNALSAVRIDYRYTSSALFLTHSGNDADDLNLEPEISDSIGIQYTNKGFTIGLSTDVFFGNDSGLRNFYLSWFGQRFGMELFYQKYTNYFIAKDESSGKKYPDTPNEYPDLSILNSGLSLYYFFRENNYRGLNSQGDELLQNSWSPLVKLTGGWFSFQNDDPIIPADERPYFHEDVQNMNRGDFYQLNFSVGLTGTLVWGRFYCSAIASIGGAIIDQHYRDINGNRYVSVETDIDFDYQMFIGFTGESYFFGFWFMNENFWASIEDLNMQLMNLQLSMYAGMRL